MSSQTFWDEFINDLNSIKYEYVNDLRSVNDRKDIDYILDRIFFLETEISEIRKRKEKFYEQA